MNPGTEGEDSALRLSSRPGLADERFRVVAALMTMALAVVLLGSDSAHALNWAGAVMCLGLSAYWFGRQGFGALPLLVPVTMTGIGLLAVALGGWAYASSTSDVHRNLSHIPDAENLRNHVAASLAFFGGFAACSRLYSQAEVGRDASAMIARIVDKYAWQIVGFSSVILAALTFGSGLQQLLGRDSYLHAVEWSNIPMLRLGSQLAFPATVMAALTLVCSRQRTARIVSASLLLCFLAVNFSLATREVALVPISIAFACLANEVPRSRKHRVVLAVVCLFVAYWLMKNALSLRSSAAHGLLPYMEALFSSGELEFEFELRDMFANLLNAFRVSGHGALETAYNFDGTDVYANTAPPFSPGGRIFDERYATYSLSPWYWTPHTAIGMLANAGKVYLFSYFLMAGAVFGLASRVSQRRTRSSGGQLSPASIALGAVVAGMSLLFAVMSLQYPIRLGSWSLYIVAASTIACKVYTIAGRASGSAPIPGVGAISGAEETSLCGLARSRAATGAITVRATSGQ